MDKRIVLAKVITLLYRTRLVGNLENDDLIRTILKTIKVDLPEHNFNGHNLIKTLRDICTELLEDKDPVSKEVLLQRLSLTLEPDPKLLKVLKEGIEPDYDDGVNKRVITSHIKALNTYYRESQATEIISRINYELKFKRNEITNFPEYLKKAMAELEPLTNGYVGSKDPGLVNEVDFEMSETVELVMEEVKNLNNNTGIYVTGWQGLNRMTQGGFRRGEYSSINALPHNAKTLFSMSIFLQIATLNKPIVFKGEEEKKPLLLRISFEDNLTNNLQFAYQYLKANEGVEIKQSDFNDIPTKEMTEYIISKTAATGFSIKMIRVNPSEWSIFNIFNKVIELESQGYQVHVLMLDYLGKVPTTGCSVGALGADRVDQVRRVRNFCSAKNIALITPTQLSTEAKTLLRNGVTPAEFPKQVNGRGYYQSSKSLDTEFDLEMYIHLVHHKGRTYLAVQRGKHRIPTVTPEEDLYFMLPFPNRNSPILEDKDKEDSSIKRLPRGDGEGGSGNLLSEVLA